MRSRFTATAVILTVLMTPAVLVVTGATGGRSHHTSAVTALPDLPPRTASTDERLTALRAIVRAAPRRADGFTLLASAELQRVRETGDASSYERAQRAVDRALQLNPGDQNALTVKATLEGSRHDFRAALRDARDAHALDPTVLEPYAPLVDAYVELGRYNDAKRTLQAMIDRKPELASLARVSYLRELHGDLPGALAAIRAAKSAGGGMAESTAFVAAIEGGLYLQRGELVPARRAFREALARFPGYAPAESGLARLEAATGNTRAALRRLRRLVERLPLPEHVTALAELELANGERHAAQRDITLVRVERTLQRNAGVVVDTEAAVFEADHGDAATAVRLAARAYAAAPSVRSADAMGWSLTRAGHARDGLRWMRRALRLGWRDPAVRAHAGLAAAAAGRGDLAGPWLRQADRGTAALGPWQATRVKRALAILKRRTAS